MNWTQETQRLVDLEQEAILLARLLIPRIYEDKKVMRVYSNAVRRLGRRQHAANKARATEASSRESGTT